MLHERSKKDFLAFNSILSGHSLLLLLLLPYSVQLHYSEDSETFIAYWAILVFRNPPNSDTDYRIFNVRM